MRVNESKLICTEAVRYQEVRPSARTPWHFAALLCLLALLCPLALRAQNFAYVNNQSGVSNSITSFSVDTGGVATSLGTVSTGGTGAPVACAGIDRITVNLASNLLFVSNGGNQTISVFRITPATGALAAVAGSPFPSGLTLDSCSGISLAATPDGHFLMASSNGQIKTFRVAVSGSLSVSATASLLPSPMVGMKISGDGRFLAVSHQASVSVFAISAVDGSLTAVAGSPFAKAGTGLVGGLDFNCDGTLLYAAEGGSTSSLTDAWSVAGSGVLTPILGSPFVAAGNDSNVVFLTPDNTILYQSNQGSKDLNTFTVNPDGTLTSIGLASIAAGHTPAGLAGDTSGLFLYGADDAFGLAVFNIVPGVVPTLVGDTAIAGAGQIQGVAAYPPRSCAHTDFSVTQTASPNPVTAGNQLTYTITVTNNGPSAASVAINDLLPRNFVTFVSCTPGPGGVCDKGAGLNRTITFASLASGQSGTATLVASSVSTLLNGDTISNTSNVSNSSAVDPNPANNSASTSVTVSAPLAATNFIVANSTGNYFGTTALSTTLKRTLNGAAVAGRSITFSLDGIVVGTAVTNATGVASLPNVSLVLGGIPITAGSHSIGVNFAGDSQYQGSTGTSTLTVNKAVLSVTAQNASKIYGDANPAFTYVISGFLNNETVAVVSGTANCISSANVGTSAGTAPITCAVGTLLATNYSFTFVPATLTINRAPLVLAGNSVSRLYGDPNPAITGTVTGLKAGDQATATFSSTALSTSPVGTYPITGTVVPGSSFLAANYSVTSTGIVTVNPAPLSATATSASRVYGDTNPTLTGTITGAKNGDVFTATFASAADPTSPVGTYPIVASLSGAPSVISNYTVTSNNGTLTVTPAALSVTAANASRLYGDPNPLFTGTITGIKNADNITATYASAAVTSPVGTFAIVPTLVDPTSKLGNYTVTSNNGTLTISPAPLSVAAANASRLYGDANPLLSGTITGLKNSDAITATYASVADPTSSVGTFAIVPTLVDPTAKLGNYSVLSTNGILTVNKAPLIVAGTNVSRIYGDPNPALSGTITGIKNADNITATFASTATATSPVGGYPITPSLVDPTTKLGNYSVTLTNGTLTVSPASLIVTGTNASRLYGDPNPAFTGTITGLKNADNVTATFASAATAASAVGGYPIVPTLVDPTAKLGNYSVTSNNGTLTVNPAALTVTAADATRVYGDPNPAFTGSIAGLKNGDIITATFASPATAGSAVGAYAITPSLADPTAKLGNYTVTSNNGTLTITAASLTVNAGNASRAYGDPNPAFAGTIIGLKNGDAITATYASIAGTTSPVGTYPIAPVLVDPTAKLGNYNVTLNNGTLTVTPALLSVTATNTSRLYGDPNPVFAGSIAGLKNGDAITATFATLATSGSPVGTYAIVPTLQDPTAKLGNYTASSINGVLTVTPAPLNVSAASTSRVYGDPNPVFTGSVTGLKNGDVITATFASAATAASAVGTYPIIPTLSDPTARLGNYSLVSNNGTLTVSPAALTVSANNATRAYGDANPLFTGTISGLKNGDNITASFTSADPTSAVGTYPIIPALADPTTKLGNYTVNATNGILTVTTAPLSVSVNNATRLYGDANPLFTGTIVGLKNGDNITASFTSAGAARPIGAFPIIAALADPTGKLGNYTVTSTNGTLTINPAALTVAAANATRAYGNANPSFTGTISGIKNGDNITASFASAATPASGVGTFPIVPTLLDPTTKLGNYTVTSTNGTLTVSPAALTVTGANASRIYGDPNPTFAGTIAGLKNGDNITATFASAVNPGSSVGTYPISPTLLDPTAKLGNYTVSSINGVLTVSPAPLNVTTASASRVYGDPNPAFTGTLTGQKNGDVITATFASVAVAASPVGTYPVVATLVDPGTKLGNYTINSSNGILTVTPAALTVNAGNSSRLYGDPNPPFTGTITGLKNGDNITATIAGAGADPSSPVGTYTLVPSLVDPTGKLGNYTVTSNNGILTVNPAALTVIAANAARAYGRPNPAFTGTIAGLKNADNITATYASVANIDSILGTYPIVPTLSDPSLKLGNYTVTSKNGTLIVGPATPTVVLTVQPGLSTALLTAQVLNAGSIFPTGTVQFSEGTTALGQPVTLTQTPPGTPPTASLQVPLTGGTHTISATYSGDVTYTASAASPVTVVVAGPPPGLRFVPVTPCRIADTRNPVGPFGAPFVAAGTTRAFAVPDSACNIPATAQAYSVNVTVVPKGPLGFLTMFPCGQALPLASTLNSTDGRVKAAAAIVPAGTSGGVCAFATNNTELILDINGYFVTDSSPSVLAFYPVAPCRLVDTRSAAGALGGPSLIGNATRTFPILSSPCGIPATAKAYSLNFTSVPKGSLGFLSTWPAGQPIPLVSTLNATTGAVTANAAIVPSGTNGDISVFVTNDSDLVVDINGYFAPPGTGGLSFFPLTPCRVVDTRNPAGAKPFTGTLDVNVTTSGCGAPASAQSFVLNATVVPPGPLGFLTLWPQGAAQPLVSTLNAIDGAVTSNMAIVPTTNGSVSAFVSNPNHLVLDISGYFAP
jgi:6-phosphogluconolactonase (cycloisomerase 2 family)